MKPSPSVGRTTTAASVHADSDGGGGGGGGASAGVRWTRATGVVVHSRSIQATNETRKQANVPTSSVYAHILQSVVNVAAPVIGGLPAKLPVAVCRDHFRPIGLRTISRPVMQSVARYCCAQISRNEPQVFRYCALETKLGALSENDIRVCPSHAHDHQEDQQMLR